MKSDEIKIFSNMSLLLPRITIKDSYTEEDYFYIFQLIDGYNSLENYFQNKDEINKILNNKIGTYKLIDLIRIVRNRYSHIDKNNALDALISLQAKVDKKDIHILIENIKNEMNNIFKVYLNQDTYKLIMNTRMISNLFGSIDYSINQKERINSFDEYCAKELKKIMDKFDYENSTEKEFDDINNEIVRFYKTEKVKKGIIHMYGEDIYNELLQMLIDDSYQDSKAIELINKIKDYTALSNDWYGIISQMQKEVHEWKKRNYYCVNIHY